MCLDAVLRLAVTPMDGAPRGGITRAFAEHFPAFEERDFAEVKP